MKTLIITILLSVITLNTNAANLSVHPGPKDKTTFIRLIGDITLGDNQRLKTLLKENPNTYAVSLSSPGGSVFGGIELAKTIREANLDTFVGPGVKCMSACVNVFLGGVYRTAYADSKFGIHPFILASVKGSDSANDVFEEGQRAGIEYAHEWAQYVMAGKEYAAIKYLRDIYLKTDHKSMYHPDVNDLKELSVITRLAEK